MDRENKNNLQASSFGEYRIIDLSRDKKMGNEIFFSIEPRDENGRYSSLKTYGYFKISEEMQTFIDRDFFTGCSGIKFIQWNECWNVVFDEASIIGGISFKMSFEEFDKLFAGINIRKK